MRVETGMDAAIAALQAGNLPLAEQLCSQARQKNPFDSSVADVLAMVQLKKGDCKAALATIKNALSIDGSSTLYHTHHGIILRALGRFEDARKAYEEALALDPEAPDTLFNLALLCQDTGDLRESLTLCLRVTRLDPSNAAAFNNLGTTHQHLGQFEEAATAYRTAIALNPGHIGAYCNLATALAEGDQIKDSLIVCEEALEKWPGHSEILNAQSNAHVKAQNWDAALAASEASISNAPEFAQAHYGKSLILLTQARLEQAWPEFEWRIRRPNFWPQRHYGFPIWDGGSLAKKTLLVHWEQGFGDIIQFCRYLPLLKSLDAPPAKLLFDCPDKLIPLFTDWECLDAIADFGDTPPEVDYFIPLMSLPGRLGTTLETIPAATPYLVNPLSDHYEVPALERTTLKVGIVWASDHGASYRRKVCPIAEIANLFDMKHIAFYGLQFGEDARELDAYTASENVHSLANDLGGFDHTAAIIEQMDVVLSIDTYIVHLAGAMNIPAWIMLPYTPDWRWFLDRSDTPWYPGSRLFRQQAPGDWASVIDTIRPELEILIAQNR